MSGVNPSTTAVGGGVVWTSRCSRATFSRIAITALGSDLMFVLNFRTTRPSTLRCVQLRTRPEISSEFGTIRLARSKVSISVERTEMRRTLPC